MNDSLRLTIIMPYILTYSINYKHYKTEVINKIKNDYHLNNQIQVPSIIVNCWIKIAKVYKHVFKSSYIVDNTYNDYTILKKMLKQVAEALLKVLLLTLVFLFFYI